MPAIQRLYDACKVSFSPNGPISPEALEHVRSILGEAKVGFTSIPFLIVLEAKFL